MKRSLFIFLMLFTHGVIATTPEKVISELGYKLDTEIKSAGSYLNHRIVGKLVYLSGKGPVDNGKLMQGKLGKTFKIKDGQKAARLTALQLLSSLKLATGELSKVKKIVKLTGHINSTNEFKDHVKVMNAASDFIVKVFGPEIGAHARAVYGANSLPFDIPIEIEMIAELK